jgi:hypothetical protein
MKNSLFTMLSLRWMTWDGALFQDVDHLQQLREIKISGNASTVTIPFVSLVRKDIILSSVA